MRRCKGLVAAGLAVLLLLAGCRSSRPTGGTAAEYQVTTLAEAPAVLQRHYAQQKAVPGLTVYENGGQTYLLLRAGRTEQPGLGVQILAVKPPVDGSQTVQVVAMLQASAAETGTYPYALLVLPSGKGLTYKARLSTHSEVPLELPGIPLAEQ